MDWLKDKVFAAEAFGQIEEHLSDGARLLVKNVPGSLAAFVVEYLNDRCKRPVLLITESLEDAEEVADDLTTLMGERSPCLLPGKPGFGRALTAVEQSERAEVLLTLTQGQNPVVVTTAAALLDPLPAPGDVSANMYTVSRGEILDRESLLRYLTDAGYKREILVEGVGQFAVRGAVVDIYPFGASEAVRLEFYGDDVESIRHFDPSTQKSTGEIEEVTLMAAEMGEEETAHLLDHLPPNTVLVWSDGRGAWNAVKKVFEERASQATSRRFRDFSLDDVDEAVYSEETELADILDEEEEPEDDESAEENDGYKAPVREREPFKIVDPAEIRKDARKFMQVFLGTTPHGDEASVDVGGLPQERFAANLPLVAERLKEYHADGIQTYLLCDSQVAGERLAQVLEERGCPEDAFEVYEDGLHHGFTMPAIKLAVLVDHDIFGRMRRRRRFMKFKNVVPLHDIDALKPGDFVVHVDYGIGRYRNLTKIEVGGVQREVLKIEYRDGVTLFVKLENLAQVQKYSGREGFQPPLSKIGGRDWRELKKKTKKSLLSIAEDLIKLYAERKAVKGHSYSQDTAWQREMEAMFPYEDTPDQMRAAEEVKSDMESMQPMDRLICGDVGYGKTEIAMRAAFKAVTDGKQVAVLVPTTILAQQHYRTFKERFKNWPVSIEVVSRFQAPREQRHVLQRLGEGKVDVIIGTHRLLSKDVCFSDLGLLIIDEEHRFGVVQKERIKSLRANIDVLAMSATPIPRTLHMALMGARDLSQINTPPPNRQPIETDVVPFSEKVIKDAILYEIERGGQVFFVHNRIESIPSVKRMLERILPNVRFAVAHGQMDEDELARVMVDFIEGNFDVLISTMIIESGLDLPNVNTMIVNRADHFGVAQLHQLRGRIGRSSRKAYAYLMVPPKFEMSRIARERLAALTNFSSLGAGFQVAMRDLEIRGAGNLLGREQSGYINAVGFEMYQRLIEEAVREVQVEHADGNGIEPEPVELKLKLEADAFFAEDYMPEGGMRLNYYRELSRTKELAQVDETLNEVADRFGRLPEASQNLFDMVRIRILGEKLGAEKITIDRPQSVIEFPQDSMSREQVLNITARSSGFPVEFAGSGALSIRLPLGMMKKWQDKLGYVIRYLKAVLEPEQPQPAEKDGRKRSAVK
jgi:transcription-repair coupling factor (superfamily II helicase)